MVAEGRRGGLRPATQRMSEPFEGLMKKLAEAPHEQLHHIDFLGAVTS